MSGLVQLWPGSLAPGVWGEYKLIGRGCSRDYSTRELPVRQREVAVFPASDCHFLVPGEPTA